MLKKLDGFQILIAAVNIGEPFSGVFGIIQIQHGSHRIHPQPVNMILFQPVQSIGNQEIGYLRAAQVKNLGPPFRVFPPPGISVFVKRLAVEAGEGMGIPGEVGRHPVHNHTDAQTMHLIDKKLKIIR